MTCLVDVARHTPGLTSGLSARRAFLPGSALRAISRHLEKGDLRVRRGCRQAPQERPFRNSLTALVLSPGAPPLPPGSGTLTSGSGAGRMCWTTSYLLEHKPSNHHPLQRLRLLAVSAWAL